MINEFERLIGRVRRQARKTKLRKSDVKMAIKEAKIKYAECCHPAAKTAGSRLDHTKISLDPAIKSRDDNV